MRFLLPPVLLVAAITASACTQTTTPNAEGTQDGSAIVLADATEPATLNPLLGYGSEGVSKIFDGLVEHGVDRTVHPQLAAELPTPAQDGLSWTVKLRNDVKFTDGTTFGAEDVLATYRALLDPATGSTVRSSFAALTGVEQLDVTTVRFTLAHPYAPFPNLLVLGILPSEALAGGGPLANSPINTGPVGTGPYKLVEWRKGDRMVLESNPAHLEGDPKVKKVTVVFVPDDNTRAQGMQKGEYDGTDLPPRLATVFSNTSGLRVLDHRTADLRAITLPTGKPVTGDPAMRLALNLAVNRQGMIDNLLAGKGTPASTPVPAELPEFVDPTAVFKYDKVQAEAVLDLAGWVRGADGMRARNGVAASFTLMYPVGDVVRGDLATAFAADAKAIGVDVQLAGLSREAITPRLHDNAVLGGEGNPFDLDPALYRALHSAPAGGADNPGGYSDAAVDAALDAGRKLLDPAQRTAAYVQFQRAYVADPGLVTLAFVSHTYVMRENWNGYLPVVDPTRHGALTWGPWWNLQKWTPK